MPYTTNPNMPRIRKEAAQLLVRKKWSTRKVARHFGFSQSVIVKWFKKSKKYGYNPIPTKSSRPHHHPREISLKVKKRIVSLRLLHGRTSEVIHQQLKNEGVVVSLNSVRRTIDRAGLMKKRSPWKRYHPHVSRPYPIKSGDLVQFDTIHLMISEKKRISVFTLIDVYSRWVYAKAYEKMNSATTISFLTEARRKSTFHFDMLQTDHGPEFSKWFVTQIKKKHRYTRIGKPNDNAHIERFNRTLQEECLDVTERKVTVMNEKLKVYLKYYNTERLHMGINFKTPMQIIRECSQGID